ncbi:hypothetical protein CN140_02650 [Sinorhizobium meliloti]|uniref:Uncharacterized protein n=1 Tax=Rhizobium meliloti TaxID=382 RepID=A0AAW9TSQ9_RHIML|nr:hypothetical protein [Sinorhizobium meliloti]MCM5689521.1 hypothetical protein [Sinorhizobium meliloti]MQW35049.1 hypothetical protein [Sinorhizobium meliloti]RVL87474.1 hypothetical protein CN140_02650 [Sinorhizobium meliloti]
MSSNVIQFPEFVGVEIFCAVVTSATIIGADGARPSLRDVGKRIYYVDVIEAGGGRICMWSGPDIIQARQEAEECRGEFGGRIRDLTGDAA